MHFDANLTLFRLGFLGVPQIGGGGGGGKKTTRGWNSGTIKDFEVIFWQHTHNWKLVYFSSQINSYLSYDVIMTSLVRRFVFSANSRQSS